MNQPIPAATVAATPQAMLAAILDSHRPTSLLVISLNPLPDLEAWCQAHNVTLHSLSESDPQAHLAMLPRVDMAIVADQLEYMTREAGARLIGLLRNLYTEQIVVLYQEKLAPERFRWTRNAFLAMGLKREAVFRQHDREMALYSYELARYNFTRDWNNARFWANPENWGRYWW
jgi:hypothetical protein